MSWAEMFVAWGPALIVGAVMFTTNLWLHDLAQRRGGREELDA